MHRLHARLPKNFVLEERLERYASAIEIDPTGLRGRWAEACWPAGAEGAYRRIVLDLGCGKGTFVAESARREPDALIIGLDGEPVCIAYTAQRICEEGLGNAVAVPGTGAQVASFFAHGELDAIHLNFPTPYPRKKDAELRLTSFARLAEYRAILAPGGVLRFKTDSQPLFSYTLAQLERAGYEVTLGQSWEAPVTEYEQRLVAEGAAVLACEAHPAHEPAELAELSESLVDYLPDDLEGIGYVPLGMRGTVVNLRNRARNRGSRS